MTTHFPGCKNKASEEFKPKDNSIPSINVSELVVSMINLKKKIAVLSFEINKVR